MPVVIAGSGPQEQMLRALAEDLRTLVHFVINPSSALLYALYQRARAFVFPPVEDFGIMPVEAMAAGGRVIVIGQGGAAESAKLTRGGAVSRSDSLEDLAVALDKADQMEVVTPQSIEQLFGKDRFISQIRELVTQ